MAQDIGLLLRGIGAAVTNQVPQFREQMAQESERKYIQGQREQQAQMQRAEMLQARQQAMYKDAESALKLLAAGDLDGVVRLGQERIELLKNFPGADPSDTVRITQLAQLSRAGDRGAYQALQRELLGAVQTGMAAGYIVPPKVEEKVYRPGDVIERDGVRITIPSEQSAQSTVGKIQADLEAGRITQEQANSAIANLSAPSSVVNVGGDSKEFDKIIDQQLAGYVSAASTSSSAAPQLEMLSQLAPITTEGAIPAAISRIFPTYSDANSAFIGIVNQVLPSLRVPGSGAQSDKDIEVLVNSIGNLSYSSDVKSLLVRAMQEKNKINNELADVSLQYAEGTLTRPQALRSIREINGRTILSDDLKKYVLGVTNIPQSAIDAGITSKEWDVMTAQEKSIFK